MTFDADHFRRRSVRLKNYNYSGPGWYFITVCTRNHEPLLGEVVNNESVLSEIGHAARKYWLEIPFHFNHVALAEFVIMPNHVHGIIELKGITNNQNSVRPGLPGVGVQHVEPLRQNIHAFQRNVEPLRQNTHAFQRNVEPLRHNTHAFQRMTPGSIGAIVRGYKSGVTTYCRKKMLMDVLWQRNYHEHIIRNASELDRIREYILANPFNWTADQENPVAEKRKKEEPWLR